MASTLEIQSARKSFSQNLSRVFAVFLSFCLVMENGLLANPEFLAPQGNARLDLGRAIVQGRVQCVHAKPGASFFTGLGVASVEAQAGGGRRFRQLKWDDLAFDPLDLGFLKAPFFLVKNSTPSFGKDEEGYLWISDSYLQLLLGDERLRKEFQNTLKPFAPQIFNDSEPDPVSLRLYKDLRERHLKTHRDELLHADISKSELHTETNRSLQDQIEKGRVFRVAGQDHKIRITPERPDHPGEVADFPDWSSEAQALEKQLGDKITQARSPAILESLLRSGTPETAHLAQYNAEDRELLAQIAANVPLLLVKGSYALFEKGPLAHSRRGLGNREPAIWMGEKSLNALNSEEIAQLLLEEAQHILNPFWEHGAGGPGQEQITHSRTLLEKLSGLAERARETPGLSFSEADLGVPQKAVYQLENAGTYDAILLEEIARERGLSLDDVEADFERRVKQETDRLQEVGMIDPSRDPVAKKILSIYERIAESFSKKAGYAPGALNIVDENEINAFVFRKRIDVYFFKGLYETMADYARIRDTPLTEDMIAFILAHELSHLLQHTSDQGLDARAFSESTPPYIIQMRKNAEYDADMQALELMDQAGFSVFGAIGAMNFLEYLTREAQAEAMLSSHPYVSLRKHRLTDLIFEQKTQVYPNASRPQTPFEGPGTLQSRDADFHHIVNQPTEGLLDLVSKTDSIHALDQLASMLTFRRNMDGFKALAGEPSLQDAFVRQLFAQALSSLFQHNHSVISYRLPDTDYRDLRQAAAVMDWGREEKNPAGRPQLTLKNTEIDDFQKAFSSDTDGSRDASLKRLWALYEAALGQQMQSFGQDGYGRDLYTNLILPREAVKDLIPCFVSPRSGSRHEVRSLSSEEVKLLLSQEPRKIISAYLYANFLEQAPSVKTRVPVLGATIEVRRQEKPLYLENPKYRDLETPESRGRDRDILLLRFAMQEGRINLDQTDALQTSLSLSETKIFFLRYCAAYQKQGHAEKVATLLALRKMKERFGKNCLPILASDGLIREEETPEGFLKGLEERKTQLQQEYDGDFPDRKTLMAGALESFTQNHPFVKLLKNIHLSRAKPDPVDLHQLQALLKRAETLYDYGFERELKAWTEKELGRLEALNRNVRVSHASPVFRAETDLDLAQPKSTGYASLEEFMNLPDWAVSQYINSNDYKLPGLFRQALKEESLSLESLFAFFRERLHFSDRRKLFDSIFQRQEKSMELFHAFVVEKLNQDPQEILLWHLGIFSKKDALELMEKYAKFLFEQSETETDSARKASLQTLSQSLLERLFRQSSKYFHVQEDTTRIYLKLMHDRLGPAGETGDESITNQVFEVMNTLSASCPLSFKLYKSSEVSGDGTPDYKTEATSLDPWPLDRSGFARRPSRFELHHFGWNDEKISVQSPFVTHLTELSVEQLKRLLHSRAQYQQTLPSVEYREATVSFKAVDDEFANWITLILLKKLSDPEWSQKDRLSRLDDLMKLDVTFQKMRFSRDQVSRIETHFKIDQEQINEIDFGQILEHCVGTCLPTPELEKIWEAYCVKHREMQFRFPTFSSLFADPTLGQELLHSPLGFLMKNRFFSKTVSYRQILKKVFNNDSAYSRMFNRYVQLEGQGLLYGVLKPLPQRINWLQQVIPSPCLLRDGILDLWEGEAFPELSSQLARLKSLFGNTSGPEGVVDLWSMLGDMDDDMAKLEKINQILNLAPEKIEALLEFYSTVIPFLLSPQKRSRYGATAYALWSLIPENSRLGMEDQVSALTRFMPEPSILRDDRLMQVAKRYCKKMVEVPLIAENLYSNHLLSPNKDARTEDFMGESLHHLFGSASARDRKDILLWVSGATPHPPPFVTKMEQTLKISFTTLPQDVKFLPAMVRDKFLEGFMLGDNGVLDPKNEEDEAVMEELNLGLFNFIFPPGSENLDELDRALLSRIFVIVTQAYPPMRRVQIFKALSELVVRPDFSQTSTGERLSVLLGVLGPLGIKIAQYLSENDTLIPDDDFRSSLGSLRHSAPEISKISAFAVLNNEVPHAEDLVVSLDSTVGTASIKQVNRGLWLDVSALADHLLTVLQGPEKTECQSQMEAFNAKTLSFEAYSAFILDAAKRHEVALEPFHKKVVYKIRKPSLDTTLQADFSALDTVARRLEGLAHKGHALDLSDLVGTVKEWILTEKDFLNEARYHQELSALDTAYAENWARDAGVRLKNPRVYYATESLIVEEEIPGVNLSDLSFEGEEIPLESHILKAGYKQNQVEQVVSFFQKLKLSEPESRLWLKLQAAKIPEEKRFACVQTLLGGNEGEILRLMSEVEGLGKIFDPSFCLDGETTLEDVMKAGYHRSEASLVWLALQQLNPKERHLGLQLKKAGISEDLIGAETLSLMRYDVKKIRRLLREVLLNQLFVDGVFHADLHQGNIMITPGGELVLIDRGNVGKLNPEQIQGAKRLLKGFLFRNAEAIKSATDQIFLNAPYPPGQTPVAPFISIQDIRKILDENLDMKNTMNKVAMASVKGTRNSPGAKSFSTFLKAFTQALHLFPTDLTSGMESFEALAAHLSLNPEEIREAAQIQAQFTVGQELEKGRRKNKHETAAMEEIIKQAVYGEKTGLWGALWKPILFRIAVRTWRYAEQNLFSDFNPVQFAQTRGFELFQLFEEEWYQNRLKGLNETLEKLLTLSSFQKTFGFFLEKRFGEKNLWSRILVKAASAAAVPVLKMVVRGARTWFENVGKHQLNSMRIGDYKIIGLMELAGDVLGGRFSGLAEKFSARERREKMAADSKPETGEIIVLPSREPSPESLRASA